MAQSHESRQRGLADLQAWAAELPNQGWENGSRRLSCDSVACRKVVDLIWQVWELPRVQGCAFLTHAAGGSDAADPGPHRQRPSLWLCHDQVWAWHLPHVTVFFESFCRFYSPGSTPQRTCSTTCVRLVGHKVGHHPCSSPPDPHCIQQVADIWLPVGWGEQCSLELRREFVSEQS